MYRKGYAVHLALSAPSTPNENYCLFCPSNNYAEFLAIPSGFKVAVHLSLLGWTVTRHFINCFVHMLALGHIRVWVCHINN